MPSSGHSGDYRATDGKGVGQFCVARYRDIPCLLSTGIRTGFHRPRDHLMFA